MNEVYADADGDLCMDGVFPSQRDFISRSNPDRVWTTSVAPQDKDAIIASMNKQMNNGKSFTSGLQLVRIMVQLKERISAKGNLCFWHTIFFGKLDKMSVLVEKCRTRNDPTIEDVFRIISFWNEFNQLKTPSYCVSKACPFHGNRISISPSKQKMSEAAHAAPAPKEQ